MKYHIITFGCQMNKSDSERIATVLENRGYQPASNINEADLIVVNMCSVRQSAVDRVYGKISDFAKLKVKNEKLKVILTGCITKSDKRKFENKFDQILKFKDLLKEQPKYQDKSIVYVPISSGCNNACTYCVVPFTRGSLVCRNHREILKEAKKAVQNGAKEIWLLGQNVNSYKSKIQNPTTAHFQWAGSPSPLIRAVAKSKINSKSQIQNSKQINFAELLRMVNDIPGNFWLRFMSPHPADFSDKLIETMVGAKKITKYLHLPVQSGDNEILKKMNRPYTVEQYKNLVKKIRKKIPKINLSTDIIVGFPGETEKQFQNTVKLFKEIKFNYAYIAKYSPRPGTAAFKLKDDVSLKEKKRRWKILNSYI